MKKLLEYTGSLGAKAPVAQWIRASRFGREGREFKSLQGY